MLIQIMLLNLILTDNSYVLFLLKEKVPKSTSMHKDTTHPCTRLDWAKVLLYPQLLNLDVRLKLRK